MATAVLKDSVVVSLRSALVGSAAGKGDAKG